MKKASKIRLLNALLAAGSPFARDICADAAVGVGAAVSDLGDDCDLSEFAKKILKLYDPRANVEVLDFKNGYFDSLFAYAAISNAAKRLSGYPRGILVVASLDRAGIPHGGKMSERRRKNFAENAEFVEDCLMRYKSAFDNVEILFV